MSDLGRTIVFMLALIVSAGLAGWGGDAAYDNRSLASLSRVLGSLVIGFGGLLFLVFGHVE